MSEKQLKQVKNLKIENKFGKIEWVGETDILGLDFDYLVEIKQGEVIVYPEEEKEDPQGTKLNKATIITLYNIPSDLTSEELKNDYEIESELKEICQEAELDFLSNEQQLFLFAFSPFLHEATVSFKLSTCILFIENI